jgi:excisionase family DNA binding protein
MPRPHNLEERTVKITTPPWRDTDDQDRGEGCAAEPDPQPDLQQADRRAIRPNGTAAPSSLSLPLPSADDGQGRDGVTARSRPAGGPIAGDPVPLLFTPAQAATALQVRESWLRRRAASREVPCTFLGKHLRFSRADLDQIVADAARRITAQPSRGGRSASARRPRRPQGRDGASSRRPDA